MNTGRLVTPKIFGLIPQPCFNESEALDKKLFHLSSHSNYSEGTPLFRQLTGINDASTVDFTSDYIWNSSNGLILQSGNTTKIYRISIVNFGPSIFEDTESSYSLNFTEITSVDELIQLSHMFCRGDRNKRISKERLMILILITLEI